MNKDKLLNFIESLKNEKYNRFINGPMGQNEYFEIVQVLNEVKSFVNEEEEEEGFSCHNCKYLIESNYAENYYRCIKYNLLMHGIPSSKICADNS
jgi:hypothetical protein